jgi:hypothetical protein
MNDMEELNQKISGLGKKEIDIKIILQAVLALALVGAVYLGYRTFDTYRAKARLAEETLIAEKAAEAEANQARDQELNALRQELTELKNKPAEPETVTVEAKDAVVNIVKEWTPRVAYVECSWTDQNGRLYAKAAGSATIMWSGGEIRAVTNKHVLLYQDEYGPHDCKLTLPNITSYDIVNDYATNFFVGTKEDWGFIKLSSDKFLNGLTKKTAKICTSAPETGDKLLVLGYPTIGSTTGLTVTEGIVSGEDGNYYITSAKIDHGNSGGAAILVKDDCYLGIPSASVVGSIESLGRILKAKFVIE